MNTTLSDSREVLRAQVAQLTEEYLNKGGKIQKIGRSQRKYSTGLEETK